MSHITFRKAEPNDTQACLELRGKTRENAFSIEQLAAAGITLDSWRRAVVDGAVLGYVAVREQEIVGYCFAGIESAEIAVLALNPAYENLGIGKQLLKLVVDEFRVLGTRRLVLSCSADPQARSYGFYRHIGWMYTGKLDSSGDEILEYWVA